jgi:hypothetical protein
VSINTGETILSVQSMTVVSDLGGSIFRAILVIRVFSIRRSWVVECTECTVLEED